jgi:hypothetical protein
MGRIHNWFNIACLSMSTKRIRMLKGLGVVCALALLLTGCGVTGGANSGGGKAISYGGKAEGIYLGTTSNSNSFEIIVLPNDQYYEVYGTLTGNPYSVSGMILGQGASGNGTYTANVTNIAYTGQTTLQNVNASFATGASIGGTLTNVGNLSGISFTGSALPGSFFNFDTRASLSDLSGSWTGTLLDGTSTTFTADSNGMLNGSASGCLFSGAALADSSNHNFFDVTLTFGGAPCALGDQTATGIAVECLLTDGVTHQLVVVVTQGTGAGTTFFAQRSSSGVGVTPNALNGQYAFSLAGFDSAGNPVSLAGSINADGLGHITGGEVDVNDNGAISSDTSLSGTYAFDSNIPPAGTYVFNSNVQGTIGTIALTYTAGTVSHPLAFGFSLQSGGSYGQIMSLDINDFVASGTMEQQSSSAFTLASLAGDYVVALNGRSASNPTSTLGRFTLASGGASSNVTFDRSMAGVGTAGPTTGASATVVFGSAGPDANGRGTFTLTLNDALGSTTQNFVYYAISAKRILAVETDGNGTMTAEFSGQSTPITTATVVTTGSVFAMSGVDAAVSNNEITAVGQLQMTGVGANTGTLRWDSNDAGNIVGPASFASQAVPAFDTTTGRGTVTIAGGALSGLADSVVFYLTGPGTGFLMDTTSGVFNRAMTGPLTAQAGGPYSAVADLAGLGIIRSRSSVNNAPSSVGLFGLTTIPGTYGMNSYQRFSNGGVVQTQMDQSAPGITVQSLDEITGRGTLSIPSGSKSATKAFYVVGPNQFVFIDISPVSSGLNGPSSLFFVDAH